MNALYIEVKLTQNVWKRINLTGKSALFFVSWFSLCVLGFEESNKGDVTWTLFTMTAMTRPYILQWKQTIINIKAYKTSADNRLRIMIPRRNYLQRFN